MSREEKKRAAEPAHVIAAKNLADKAVSMGVKRAEFLEEFSRRAGLASWNAYREAGRVSVRVPLLSGRAYQFEPGLITATPEAFRTAANAILRAAVKAGYSCDHSAPLIISDRLENFRPFTRAADGLVLSPDVGHRSFRYVEGLPNSLVTKLLTPRMRGFTGVIILDLPDAHPEDVEALTSEAAPGAIILAHPTRKHPTIHMERAGKVRIDFSHGHDHVAEPVDMAADNGMDMWQSRALSMLAAFSRSGQPFDSRAKPDINDIDPSHPAMAAFLFNLPGYDPARWGTTSGQDGKTREQYGFLSMQM